MDLKSKKGQTGFFFLFMIGVTMFILGFALATPLVTTSNEVRANMDCGNQSIDISKKVTCGVLDIIAPWFVGVVLALAGMAIGAKIIGG